MKVHSNQSVDAMFGIIADRALFTYEPEVMPFRQSDQFGKPHRLNLKYPRRATGNVALHALYNAHAMCQTPLCVYHAWSGRVCHYG